MCGILAVFSPTGKINIPNKFGPNVCTIREMAHMQSRKQRHRGPDHTGVVALPDHGVVFVQERLAVIRPATGDQPFKSADGSIIMQANGEIYNFLELSSRVAKVKGQYEPRSDCDVIIAMYEQLGSELVQHILGMYTFTLYDKNTKRLLVGRDPIGIIPLYRGTDEMGNLWFSSEMKCLVGVCDAVENFEPGTLLTVENGKISSTKYYQPSWTKEIPTCKADLKLLHDNLVNSVRSHLQSDVPFGSLLSGGVDSSLIASIATKILRERDPNFKLKTFSIGLENSPDLHYARKVANYIDSDHREILFTIEDGIDCIREAIYHLEAFSFNSVYHVIPFMLLVRFVKSEGLKMVLSGEGADEIFGGYSYFNIAPNAAELHKELVNRVLNMHTFIIRNANKSSMAYGLELRVPFLDTNFLNFVMNIRPDDKIYGSLNDFDQNDTNRVPRIEKHILRAAFANDYIPDEVLWRKKERFPDGVGHSFIESVRVYAQSHVSDDDFSRANEIFPIDPPMNKEEFYCRRLFEEMYPGDAYAKTVPNYVVPAWVPRTDDDNKPNKFFAQV